MSKSIVSPKAVQKHGEDIVSLQDGLGFVAIKSGSSWILPSGTDAIAGQYIVVNGVLGKAKSAVTGGSTVLNSTTWEACPSKGALSELSDQIVTVNSHIAPKSSTNWSTYPGSPGRYVYYYEGANATTYNIPFPHCFVVVEWMNAARGCAAAYKWAFNAYSCWTNAMHETWKGWKLHSAAIEGIISLTKTTPSDGSYFFINSSDGIPMGRNLFIQHVYGGSNDTDITFTVQNLSNQYIVYVRQNGQEYKGKTIMVNVTWSIELM